jgi:tetratricopeptide (TPR) repeat protein
MVSFRLMPAVGRLIRVVMVALMVGACAPLSLHGQQIDASASVRGIVHDSLGKPIPGATLHLYRKDASEPQTAHADSQGAYAFTSLHEGVYTIDAEMAGFQGTTVSSIFLAPKESKTIDFNLIPVEPSGTSSVAEPDFYYQPQFRVSGVTDATSLGGHGSDTIVRTRETIAKDTVSLAARDANSPASPAVLNSLREDVEREPRSAEANCRLGQALIAIGQASEAIPFLERATQLEPDDYEASYNLALANENAGRYDHALAIAEPLLLHHDQAQLHHLLGDVDEKLGNPLEAVRQYQRAAALEPREAYLFDWGSELLLHHAAEPALDVFSEGHRRFPHSVRMLVGLGAASFARGDDNQAVAQVCEASDLDPKNETPYLFLGKMQAAQSAPSDAVLEKLHRFVTLSPNNAAANYYYGIALWKRRSPAREAATTKQVQSLFERSVQIEPHFSAAHLQLGILHSEHGDFTQAIAEYKQAIESASPKSAAQLEEAHYRLAQAYRETGDIAKAKAELDLYRDFSRQSAQDAERERHEIRQFVYSLRDQPPPQNP